jgi:hypothetical protein
MGMRGFAGAGRKFDEVDDGLVAGRTVVLKSPFRNLIKDYRVFAA